MSGDISDQQPLPEDAGIIPRVLHGLFDKLDSLPNSPNSGAVPENDVKVSFIELYNEELRDLLSADDNTKLKIYEGDGKSGHAATLVQGMEERHIASASRGIKFLREGSHKRQVAATKCNDLSSRSHTIFTVTVLMKRTTESGEEVLSEGKVNLVDLAGSENIQRSGAENKRAAEAGLINKSLLTLGRVINALVDKSSHKGEQHIPYRGSKLTRLLQDSLGGETKTCIIATLSPAQSNLKETISTLDYAFRAKNIRNKPQINHMLSKKTVLREFTIEIEKLKSELIATRHRNGVYLTPETYDEITTESESRKILAQEQRDKIETIECNLKNKIQELFYLTTTFNTLKKDNEATKLVLDNTKGVLERTEIVLDHTKRSLEDETYVREQHERTEQKLANMGEDLISTLGKTTADIGGLHSKLRRRSNLHSANRQHWSGTQTQVSQTTSMVEERLQEFQEEQQSLVENISSRMQSFVKDELEKLQIAKVELHEKSKSFDKSQAEVTAQATQSKDELNSVLEEIKSLREEVKQNVGSGLKDLSAASQRISAGIMTEIGAFHTQLHTSYAALGRDFKVTFDDLVKGIGEQRDEVDRLRTQISEANVQLARQNDVHLNQFQGYLEQEQTSREQENKQMMLRIQELVDTTARQQQMRMQEIGGLPAQFRQTQDVHTRANTEFGSGSERWVERSKEFSTKLAQSRDGIKTRIQGDYVVGTLTPVMLTRYLTISRLQISTRKVSALLHLQCMTKRLELSTNKCVISTPSFIHWITLSSEYSNRTTLTMYLTRRLSDNWLQRCSHHT
jgi:kinesin family protein 11